MESAPQGQYLVILRVGLDEAQNLLLDGHGVFAHGGGRPLGQRHGHKAATTNMQHVSHQPHH